jgi:hypothetical protein
LRDCSHAHAEFVRLERWNYHGKRHLAITKPEENISLIVDGADQRCMYSPFL